jgi:peptide/nickel transport system ATP-binding protein
MGSVPRLSISGGSTNPARLQEIPGSVPSLADLPAGCSFAPRCAFATEVCRAQFPPYEEKRPGHFAACWHSDRLHGAAA